MYLKKPCFRYGAASYYYPDVTAENVTDTPSVERHTHVAADGSTASYLVGSRDFKDITFRWLDEVNDSAKTNLEAFWDEVKDGSTFQYIMDDYIWKVSAGVPTSGPPYCGTGWKCGTNPEGGAIISTDYMMDSTEIMFTQEEVDGFWQASFRMREVV